MTPYSPLRAGSKQSCLLHADFLLGLFFDIEVGGDVRKYCKYYISEHYMSSCFHLNTLLLLFENTTFQRDRE
jgi:hypothetical protein